MKYHYVYKITHIETNRKYIGSRTSKTLPENDLGMKYFSSSSDKEFIVDQKQNPQNYKYEIVKTFDTRQAANLHEVLLHNEYDVGINEEYYNRACATSDKFMTYGKITVKDEDGNYLSVNIDDPKYLDGTYKPIATGKVAVKDKDGNFLLVDNDDPKYLDGTYKHMFTGRIWMTNGSSNKVIMPDEEEKYKKLGFWRGKKQKKSKH